MNARGHVAGVKEQSLYKELGHIATWPVIIILLF